jgi:hypothetical protein
MFIAANIKSHLDMGSSLAAQMQPTNPYLSKGSSIAEAASMPEQVMWDLWWTK